MECIEYKNTAYLQKRCELDPVISIMKTYIAQICLGLICLQLLTIVLAAPKRWNRLYFSVYNFNPLLKQHIYASITYCFLPLSLSPNSIKIIKDIMYIFYFTSIDNESDDVIINIPKPQDGVSQRMMEESRWNWCGWFCGAACSVSLSFGAIR